MPEQTLYSGYADTLLLSRHSLYKFSLSGQVLGKIMFENLSRVRLGWGLHRLKVSEYGHFAGSFREVGLYLRVIIVVCIQ